jgi:Ran GTPase-activating protein (RanGAP) involved in mRNA processing and transport
MPLAAMTADAITEQLALMDPDLRLQLSRNDVSQHAIATLSKALSPSPQMGVREFKEALKTRQKNNGPQGCQFAQIHLLV